MPAETAIYFNVLLALINIALIAWLVRLAKSQLATRDGLELGWRSRFDALEHHNESLRRSLVEMDQGLRAAVSGGVTTGLTTAFDKVQEGTRSQAEGLVTVQTALNQLSETVRHGLDGVSQRLGEGQEQLRQNVEAKLSEIRTGNEAKLEQMRLTVDEKLQSTLEQRLGASFKQVNESLEQVYRSVGEMQGLAAGVGDLKRLLSNIKSRGVWTENLCGDLLADVLAPGQFDRNVEIRPGSNFRVEYAVRLPADTERPLWLPIDVKFPVLDYERLSEAADRGDAQAVEMFGRAIEMQIRTQAREVQTKYIQEGYSTEFGVIFLPTEGLFAEIVRRPGLIDTLQREHRIMIAGPSTLLTLLTAIRMGFRALAIQQRTSEVWRVLGAVKQEFGKFGGILDKVSKKLDEAQNVLENEVGTRRRAMDRSLRAVEALPESETAALLEYDAGDTLLVEDELEEPLAAQ